MLKPIIASSIFFLSLVASASAVKVTSFRYIESGTRSTPAAEMCGELIQTTGRPELIKVVSDPGYKAPANYYTWTGKDGKFCLILATFTGRANADLD